MRHKQKKVKLPEGMVIGSKVFISGEGTDEYFVEDILYYPDGGVKEIVNSSGWREAISKLTLCKEGQDFWSANDDPTNTPHLVEN